MSQSQLAEDGEHLAYCVFSSPCDMCHEIANREHVKHSRNLDVDAELCVDKMHRAVHQVSNNLLLTSICDIANMTKACSSWTGCRENVV